MTQEIEIKLRVADIEALKTRLCEMGAELAGGGTGRVHESNIVFDTVANELRDRGQLLRIRTETPVGADGAPLESAGRRHLVTLKSPVGPGWDARVPPDVLDRERRHKIREETELEIADGYALRKLLEGLGFRGWFRYEKYRTTYRLPESQDWAQGLLIELDETPIGTFMELEGPPDAIDGAARALGYGPGHYILQNYLSLYLEHCRAKRVRAGDMLFGAPSALEE